jgi:DNA-binding NarL/FixJ family response regulator
MIKTVLAYDDEETLRHQLENVFYSLRDQFSLLSTFSNIRNIEDNLAEHKPDIVILDIQMEGDDDGLNALYRIKKSNPNIKVMMLTTFDVDDKVFNAICLGADGYMLKTDFASQMPHEAMRKSLRIIFEGGAYLTPSVAKRILNLLADATIADKINKVRERFQAIFNNNRTGIKKQSGLTPMQTIVLQKIIDGKKTSEIAKELQLKENTINTHIRGVFNVLEVHSRARAIKKAMEEKWIS